MSRAAKKLGLDTRQAVHAWWKEKRARAGQPLCRIFRQPHQYDDGDETIPFRPYAVGSRAGGLRQSVRGPVAGAEGTDDKPTGRARPCYKELSNAEIMRMQKQESKMEERRRRHAMGDYSPSPKKGRKRKNADADGAAPADDEAAARRNARKAAKAAAADQKRRLKRRPKWQKQQSSTPEPLKLTAMLLKRCKKALTSIMTSDSQKIFHEPVDLAAIPHYAEMIPHPMDFGTIKTKLGESLDETQYKTVGAFAEDVRLVLRNCLTYNEPTSEIAWVAHRLGITFERFLDWWVLRPTACLPALSSIPKEVWTCQLSGARFTEAEGWEMMIWCDACETGFDKECVGTIPKARPGQPPPEWFCQYCVMGHPVPPINPPSASGSPRRFKPMVPASFDPTKPVSENERKRAVSWVVKNLVLSVEREAKEEVKRRNASKAVVEKLIRTLEKQQRAEIAQAKKDAKAQREVQSVVDGLVRKVISNQEWAQQRAHMQTERDNSAAQPAAAAAGGAGHQIYLAPEHYQYPQGQYPHSPTTPGAGAPAAAPAGSPSRYTRYFSTQHDRYFFHDTITGTSSWEDPSAAFNSSPPTDEEGFEYIMTVIPEGAAPGMTLIIDVPDTDPATNLVGSLKMQMQVPEGAKPGMMYKLKIQRSQARYQQSLVQQQQQQLQQQQ